MTRPAVVHAHLLDHGIEVNGWAVIYTPTDPADTGLHFCLNWKTAMRRANRIARRQMWGAGR